MEQFNNLIWTMHRAENNNIIDYVKFSKLFLLEYVVNNVQNLATSIYLLKPIV